MHIAILLLNYNSEKDLVICAEQVAQQKGVHLSIILVDNASRPESLRIIKSWLADWRPDAVTGNEVDVVRWARQNPELSLRSGNVYLIENRKNLGYSAGNNVGIRLADALGADAVLIINPDMRIEDSHYLQELTQHLLADRHYIVASRILDLQGKDQNPLREAGFLEELIWPIWLLNKYSRKISHVLFCHDKGPVAVPKVSGCCMLLRMDFLKLTNYLDENVFLYSEEPILSARVRAANGKIIYVPTITAIHAHVAKEKGINTLRMRQFIKSRKYYLNAYSGYAQWKIALLSASYAVLSGIYRLKGIINDRDRS